MCQSKLLEVRAHEETQTEVRAHEETKTGGDAVAAKGGVSFNTRKRAVRKFPCTLLTCVRQ